LTGGSAIDRSSLDGPILRPYTPVCGDDPIQVCVHPAYTALLDELSPAVNRMAASLTGLPGLPVRVEQVPFGSRFWEGGEVLRFGLAETRADAAVAFALHDMAMGVLRDPAAQGTAGVDEAFLSWSAIEFWLLTEAGVSVRCEGTMVQVPGGAFGPAACEEALRFVSLDPATRTTWLQTHWEAIRAGRIGLEDLP
jgi:hypothetical protein